MNTERNEIIKKVRETEKRIYDLENSKQDFTCCMAIGVINLQITILKHELQRLKDERVKIEDLKPHALFKRAVNSLTLWRVKEECPNGFVECVNIYDTSERVFLKKGTKVY